MRQYEPRRESFVTATASKQQIEVNKALQSAYHEDDSTHILESGSCTLVLRVVAPTEQPDPTFQRAKPLVLLQLQSDRVITHAL
jgi:hypothetical protein